VRPGSKAFFVWTKAGLWLLCLAPLAHLALGAFAVAGVSLGANPVEAILDSLGIWGLRLLLVTLAITPLRRISGWTWLLGYRRLLGLFAFFYIALHFVTYAWLDQGLDLAVLVEDVIKRPFITLGMLALLALLPLAATSNRAAMRRLGRRWQTLHRLVYPIAILGVWHYYWQVKLDTFEPLIYAGILVLLLGMRIWYRWRRQQARRMRHEALQESAQMDR
jgi:sulfoxide reductase heme-binding subunit YedZ